MSFLNNIVGKAVPLLNVFGHFAGWGAQNGAIGGITGMPSSATRSKLEGGGSAPSSLLEQMGRMGASQTIDYGNVTGGIQSSTGDLWRMSDEGMVTGIRPTSVLTSEDNEGAQKGARDGNLPPTGDAWQMDDTEMEVFLDEEGMVTEMVGGRPTSVMTEAEALNTQDKLLEINKKNSTSSSLSIEEMDAFIENEGLVTEMVDGKPTSLPLTDPYQLTSASSSRNTHGVDYLKTKFGKGNDPAPANRYKITFGTIGTEGGIDNVLAKRSESNCPVHDIDFVQLLCKTAEMPGRSFATGDQRTYGPLIKRPFDMITTEITMTFLITEQYSSRKFFANWMKIIHADKNHNYSYYRDFVAPRIRIEYLNKGLTESPYGVVLKNAYPMAIGPIALAYDQVDSIQEFTVTFTYEDWYQCDDTTTDDLDFQDEILEQEEIHFGEGLELS